MAARRTKSRQAYRSDELDGVADAVDHLTFGAGSFEPSEALRAPSLQRILVAFDGSPSSRPALAWAAELARRFKSQVQVVSVTPGPQAVAVLAQLANASGRWAAAGAIYDESHEAAQRDLDAAAAYLKERGVRAELNLQVGRPASTIVDFAAANASDLVILGSHGHGAAERFNLGSVGNAVKHHVRCSVLVARGPPTLKRVLLAADGSQRSRLAVALGQQIAKAFDAKVTLAHVIDMSSYGLGRSEAAMRGKTLMVQERMREMPSAKEMDARVTYGPPAKQLRKIAAEEKAGLIVLGSRGLGGLKGLALGSVSDGLTHKADPSVLVVKPKAA